MRDGTTLRSTAHRHEPSCTTLRKLVTFSLTPGTYHLPLSGSPSPSIVVEAVKTD